MVSLSPAGILPFLPVIITTLFYIFAGSVWAAPGREMIAVDAVGSAVVERQDYSRARQNAVEDALNQAFKTAVAQTMPSHTPPPRFQDAWCAVSPQRADFIIKYVMIGESADSGIYRVEINAVFAGHAMAEKLRSLGYETLRAAWVDREVILTIKDLQNYKEYAAVREFLRRGIPCVRQSMPIRFAWREARFRLTLRGEAECITQAEGPFVVVQITGDDVTGVISRPN